MPYGLVGLFLMMLLSATSLRAQPLRIAMEGQFPPFEFINEQGQLQGFNVDIAQALCQQMVEQCQLVRLEWDQLIPALEQGQVDLVLASMSITDERSKRVDFTERYAQTPAFFFARTGTVSQVIITPRRVATKRIGVQRGTTYDRYLTAKFAAYTQIQRFDNATQTYLALQEGRIDLVLDDAVSGYFGFLDTPQGQGFERIGTRVVAPAYFGKGQGIAVRKGNAPLRARLDRALSYILGNGVDRRIEKSYFNQFTVY